MSSTYVAWTGMAISSWPKKSFWNPSEPGLIIPATDGVSLPANTKLELPLVLKANINVNVSFSAIRLEENEDDRASPNRKGSQNQASAVWEVAYSCKTKPV